MPDYYVEWGIGIKNAVSHEDAARKARDILRSSPAAAALFHVRADGEEQFTAVDLAAETPAARLTYAAWSDAKTAAAAESLRVGWAWIVPEAEDGKWVVIAGDTEERAPTAYAAQYIDGVEQ